MADALVRIIAGQAKGRRLRGPKDRLTRPMTDRVKEAIFSSLGSAVIEVSAKPHTGCSKFADRFGIDAARWVNSKDGTRLRGINAKVVEPGVVRTGDTIGKLPAG